MYKNHYKLEERIERFAGAIIDFCKPMPRNEITRTLIIQLIRAATSIGANYCEANNASSKKDFRNKIFICKKESQETKYWLKMLLKALPEFKDKIQELHQECHEFNLIFQKVISTMKNEK